MKGLLSILRLAVALTVGLVLAHCAAGGGQSSVMLADGTDQAASLPSPYGVEDSNSADYRIAPQDILQVTVFQVPDLSGPRQVEGNGMISMPLVGSVDVGGKTSEQAQKEIATKLGKTYLRSPQVSVLVTKSGQRVTVSGAVGRAVVLPIEGRLTLSQAIAAAGGLSDIGNSNRIHIARIVGQNVKDAVFDLEAIQAGKAADPNLYGGDIVVAEQSGGRVAFKNVKEILPFSIFLTPLL